jgi:hypothetical protein
MLNKTPDALNQSIHKELEKEEQEEEGKGVYRQAVNPNVWCVHWS